MKKLKRSQRLVDMTQFLLERPHDLLPLSIFADRYGAAKSSISEDLAIIKEVFEGEGIGELQTLAGAAGGVRYIPVMPKEMALSLLNVYVCSWNRQIGYCLVVICICRTCLDCHL